MSYSLKTLKNELLEKYELQYDLIAWGNVKYLAGKNNPFHMLNPYYAFFLNDNKLTIVPFTATNILYDNLQQYSKNEIKLLEFKNKLCYCILTKSLNIELTDGTIMRFAIMSNCRKNMKNIVKQLDIG